MYSCRTAKHAWQFEKNVLVTSIKAYENIKALKIRNL
jgi:hypothetical protein